MPQFNALGPEPTWFESGMMPAPDAGQFPAASSVDWLRRYLPTWAGNALANWEAEGLRPRNPREEAGYALSTAMNLMPAGRMAVPRSGGPRVAVTDQVLRGRGDESVKRFMLEQDGMKGRLSVTPDGIVRNSFLHPELRGQGLGRSLYEDAVNYFGDQGKPLQSDWSVSGDASRIYESLGRHGYDVTRNPNANRTALGGWQAPTEGDPLYVVSPPRRSGWPAVNSGNPIFADDQIVDILKKWGLVNSLNNRSGS